MLLKIPIKPSFTLCAYVYTIKNKYHNNIISSRCYTNILLVILTERQGLQEVFYELNIELCRVQIINL